MDENIIITGLYCITLIIIFIIAMKTTAFIMVYRLKERVIGQMKDLQMDSDMMQEFFKRWEW